MSKENNYRLNSSLVSQYKVQRNDYHLLKIMKKENNFWNENNLLNKRIPWRYMQKQQQKYVNRS